MGGDDCPAAFGGIVMLRLSLHRRSEISALSGTSGRHVSSNEAPTGFRWTDAAGRICRLGTFWHRTRPNIVIQQRIAIDMDFSLAVIVGRWNLSLLEVCVL